MFLDRMKRVRQLWERVGLAVSLLTCVELTGYIVGLAFFRAGWAYFVALAGVVSLGVLIGMKERTDSGRTITQLYFIDLALQILALVHYCMQFYWLKNCPEWFASAGQVGYEGLSVALSIAKVLAISTAVVVPGQPGWPNLIPGMRQLRDIPGTQASDRLVYIALIGCVGYGFWLRAQHVDLTVVVWLAPVLLGMLADMGRAMGIAPVGGFSGRTRTFAARYEAMTDEEKNLADAMIEAVHDSRRELEAKR